MSVSCNSESERDALHTLEWLPRSGSTYRLQARQQVEADPTEVFDFFSRAENLEAITPDFLHFRIDTPLPIEMARGRVIDYRLRLRGLPVRWRSRITRWDPPRSFVDEQVRGPYGSWVHEHTFEAVPGGTLIIDRVDYRVPMGLLVHGWLIRPELRRIFGFRAQTMAGRFGTGRRADVDARPGTNGGAPAG
jgi:ligand-binding SRPBCC domain-containing protein